MISVGLTGGIGAGKSEVARLLASHGALVIDADDLARDVLAPGTPELAEVVEAFGSEVLRPDLSLDRGRLARLVFADPELLSVLNGIVHPVVARRSADLMALAPADTIVVFDVPLLVENQLQGEYDMVVVVDAPSETQVTRLVADRGMTEEDARARMSAQATRERRLAVADAVIDNNGTLESLERQVGDLWDRLVGHQQAVLYCLPLFPAQRSAQPSFGPERPDSCDRVRGGSAFPIEVDPDADVVRVMPGTPPATR